MKKCIHCDNETNNPKFCSQSCAATFNNKLNPKRKRKIKQCSLCKNIAKHRSKYCEEHSSYKYLLTLTKKEMLTTDTQRYRRIRSHARIVARKSGVLNQCFICGYKLYVETCHKKSLSDFPLTAKLSEINDV